MFSRRKSRCCITATRRSSNAPLNPPVVSSAASSNNSRVSPANCPRIPPRKPYFEYLYDFGDSWQHDLLLEAIVLPDPEAGYPRCLAGERSAPPEDAGGPSGYADYLEAMADPGHEEHENMLQWGGPFDPEAFSLTAVNQQLQEKLRSFRKTTTRRVSPPENTATDRSSHAAPLVRLE